MQEPYKEGVAPHLGPESGTGEGNLMGEALTGESVGQVWSSEITSTSVPTLWNGGEGNTNGGMIQRELPFDAPESETLGMRGRSMHGNRETRQAPSQVPTEGGSGTEGRLGKAVPKPTRHADRESDGNRVPEKRTNNAWAGVPGAAESVEGRTPPKGNAKRTRLAPDTEPGKRRGLGLVGVREVARRDKAARFTALLHQVSPEYLRASFFDLNPQACPGVDGMTWDEYRRDLDRRIADLHGRVQRGSYRAHPSQRVWIPKSDGRERPLGIAALEDKIVQQAVRGVLEHIYEADFRGFSYGFRPGRSPPNALEARHVGSTRKKVNWVLDADIRGFFDASDHTGMLQFLEHRIADRRILRRVRQWLVAGVSEKGDWSRSTVGTPPGSGITPLTQ